MLRTILNKKGQCAVSRIYVRPYIRFSARANTIRHTCTYVQQYSYTYTSIHVQSYLYILYICRVAQHISMHVLQISVHTHAIYKIQKFLYFYIFSFSFSFLIFGFWIFVREYLLRALQIARSIQYIINLETLTFRLSYDI